MSKRTIALLALLLLALTLVSLVGGGVVFTGAS